jgi:hypothetical protein
MKWILIALAMVSTATIGHAENYRIYNGIGLGQSLDDLTAAATNAKMLTEKSNGEGQSLYAQLAVLMGMDPQQTEIYGIHRSGAPFLNSTVLAFFRSDRVSGLLITSDWFGAQGMPAQQIAQNIADNYQIKELSYGPCELNLNEFCWATVTETGEKIYILGRSGALVTFVTDKKPSFN